MDNILDMCESIALFVNEDSQELPMLTSTGRKPRLNEGTLSSSSTLLSSISFHCENNERVLIMDSRFVESDKPYDFNGEYLLVNYSVKSKNDSDRFIVLSNKSLVLKRQDDIRHGEKVIGLFLFDFSMDKSAQN